jgi:Fic-DOC domain mobile mystery protein B
MQEQYLEGQTPLNLEEQLELIPHINTREDLNDFEQTNILLARSWVLRNRKLAKIDLFNEDFGKALHKKMYDKVWKWAGKYRTSNKNIGVEFYVIPVEIKKLFDDAKFWLQHNTYDIVDLAIIFHHRMVKIHPFANGNGRHARLYADAIIYKYGCTPLSWGTQQYQDLYQQPTQRRSQYILALRAADGGDYKPLLEFARS